MIASETRTVFWEDNQVCLIDQRKLPESFEIARHQTYQQVAEAIRTMVVRGAPAIGAAAAFGMALAAQQSAAQDRQALYTDLLQAAETLRKARPTAVNLSWAVAQMLSYFERTDEQDVVRLRQGLLAHAQKIADEDVLINKRIGEHGAALVPEQATIIHHCNTGSLATVGWGTALGVIRSAHAQGKRLHVLVDETRPRLQGAKLTSWELLQLGIPHTIIADSASGYFMRRHKVDLCIVGADRVAANGDVANKIGTYNLAIVAHAHGVPFYVAAPWSTVDMSLAHGDLIEIEERSADEVMYINGVRIAPNGAQAANPAFDVTPNEYISGIITEYGVLRPPFAESLRILAERLQERMS
ncbi:MAG: S-methyl-5-thioribose-1-phosphate isomerase [Anaerolineae bacterium]|nr:S-methyl-5-thioribose-1-phosphate isomerase [Anaerolineae bacterium]